jgi:hypothetical protein
MQIEILCKFVKDPEIIIEIAAIIPVEGHVSLLLRLLTKATTGIVSIAPRIPMNAPPYES